jgi:hypothetical protein
VVGDRREGKMSWIVEASREGQKWRKALEVK